MGGEFFNCAGQHVTVKGFTAIMPWLAVTEKNLPQFTEGEKIQILRVELYEVLFWVKDVFNITFYLPH